MLHSTHWATVLAIKLQFCSHVSKHQKTVCCQLQCQLYTGYFQVRQRNFNPLNAELDPIRHLLALAGAHHIVHVSRIRVNDVTSTYPFPQIVQDNIWHTWWSIPSYCSLKNKNNTRHLRMQVHKSSKNLGTSSKFWMSGRQHEASSTMRTHEQYVTAQNLVTEATWCQGYGHQNLTIIGIYAWSQICINYMAVRADCKCILVPLGLQ